MNFLLRTFKQRRDSDEGFTLIELMVVVLIIGILLAIAVPTFLNAQNNAKTKAATSNARTALSSVKTAYTDTQSYDDVSTSVSALKAAEPSLGWQSGASTEPGQVSVDSLAGTAPGTSIGIAVKSALGDCFYIHDDVSPGGGTFYGKVASADATASTPCTGTYAMSTYNKTATPTATSPKAGGW